MYTIQVSQQACTLMSFELLLHITAVLFGSPNMLTISKVDTSKVSSGISIKDTGAPGDEKGKTQNTLHNIHRKKKGEWVREIAQEPTYRWVAGRLLSITCFFSDRTAYSVPSLALRRADLPT